MSEFPVPIQHIEGQKAISTPPLEIKRSEAPPQKSETFYQKNTTSITPAPQIELPIQTITEKPHYTSTFTHDISDSLLRSGIQVDYVNPTPLGTGANHLVYSYTVPQERPRVIKIAKTKSVTTLTYGGSQGEKEGIDLARKVFGSYAADTTVKDDPKNTNKYFVVQEAVRGKSISNKRYKEDAQIRNQLVEIVKLNNKLYTEKKMCLDFIGMAGFKGWFKKQFKKLFFKNSEFEISNIIENEEGKLKIIDFEYFDLNNKVGLKKRIINRIGMEVNRFLVKHYFKLDIKKG